LAKGSARQKRLNAYITGSYQLDGAGFGSVAFAIELMNSYHLLKRLSPIKRVTTQKGPIMFSAFCSSIINQSRNIKLNANFLKLMTLRGGALYPF